MFQENQFTAARWCRQSGKTFIIAALLLWYATTFPQSAVGIVGPSWRQTKRILSRISSFTHKLPSGIAFKPQRTQIQFANGSTIDAFPNNPETIRGPTLNVVYCLPAGVNVTLENGNQIPIEQLEPGQRVLSFNTKTGQIEPKKVLRTFSNPLAGRRIVRLTHEFGTFDCTAEHKVYTSTRGFVASSDLCQDDKILYLPVTPKDESQMTYPNNQMKECNVLCNTVWGKRKELVDFVYDIEVEGNHNFFADGVLVLIVTSLTLLLMTKNSMTLSCILWVLRMENSCRAVLLGVVIAYSLKFSIIRILPISKLPMLQ